MLLRDERVIAGNLEKVWQVATDMAQWPDWMPHIKSAACDGPFEIGAEARLRLRGGPVTYWHLVHIAPPHSWSWLCQTAAGTLEVDLRYELLGEGKLRCVREMRVSGGMLQLMFRLGLARWSRRQLEATWRALEARAAL